MDSVPAFCIPGMGLGPWLVLLGAQVTHLALIWAYRVGSLGIK